MPKQVYDPIRKGWFEAHPEEVIRQKWIEVMIHHLGFTSTLLSVEKALHQLPHRHTISSEIPQRRIDLMAYYLDEQKDLKPLLLIECKAIALNSKALKQLMGYHQVIRSPFVALANEDEIKLAYYDSTGYQELSFLPDYNQLIQAASSKSVITPHHT